MHFLANERSVKQLELADRKKRILSALVEEYILTGEPVGSKYLASEAGISFSSATIRNEMAELTDLRFLEQPHTSAGRIPTQQGLRVYVDHLMHRYRLSAEERAMIDSLLRIGREGDVASLLEKAGSVLAELTGCASVSTAPADRKAAVRRIEVVPASPRSMLVVILTTTGVIKNRVCRVGEDLTEEMMRFFTRLVDDRFTGVALADVTPEFVASLKRELYEYTFALSPALDAIAAELATVGSEVFVGGASNLLAHRTFDTAKAAQLLHFLEQRDELLRAIGRCTGPSVRIGTESGVASMEDSALITAPYAIRGSNCGAVGIVGPVRINYPKMVSMIEYFSSAISKLISDSFGD